MMSETFYVYAIDIFICNHAVESPSTLKCIEKPQGRLCKELLNSDECLQLLLCLVRAPCRVCCREVDCDSHQGKWRTYTQTIK